jgi:hypothetical protein
MKKVFIFLAICGITFNCIAQKNDSPTVKNKQYYVQKSKKQLITGFVFLGVGATLLALTSANDQGIDDIGTNILLISGGAGCLITSTVFFISSASNKAKSKKAIAVAGLDRIDIAGNFKVNTHYYPAIGIQIKF